MKFSLKSRFSQLSLLVLLLVFIADIAGRISSLHEAAVTCVGWPVCSPQGINGWLEILHRMTILVSSVLVIYHWRKTWKIYRDHVVVLSLSTLVLVFFFSNVFIGAIRSGSNPASYMAGLHSVTAVLMWTCLVTTTMASGYYSDIATVEFPPIKIRQRIRDLFALTKPVVVSLLLVTTFGGMVAGMKAFPPLWLTVWTLLGGPWRVWT